MQNPTSYRWDLTPPAGMRYIQVRARDGAGNISLGHARRLVNYEVATDRIARGQTRVYRYMVEAGQAFTVDLELLEGDADLYVWSSREDQSAWVSNLSGTVNERVVIPADQVVAGVYQVEVYGYSAASYRISSNVAANSANIANLASGGLDPAKSLPRNPVLPVSSQPNIYTGSLPSAAPELVQPNGGHTVYLPLVRR
ncbi:MAG: hypothetical protein EI684_17845 [Candidatus Viridilinea halotolerans]|uniref:Peptidase C-terminal archaeal/bacterial domain-containing protein n=1 Tax=Candidatus Viridilinea halotolerans TaxID=2491704 RepID=A0A426TTT9_9CHLR|nr:MAG: hypothetical protein EI684_17845 [Candidatus Viridilinea halotolerans]